MDLPLISFVVLTMDRREQVLRTLRSIEAQAYPCKEIIVVDNGPAGGTADEIRSKHPAARVISTGRNLGSAAGRNVGFAAARGEHVVCMDDDCVFEDETAAESVAVQFAADPECGVIAFRIIDRRAGPDIYDPAAGSGMPQAAAVETMLFCAGAFAIRHRVIEKVGGFWEQLFMVQVDTELAIRVVNAGWRIMKRGDITVLHNSGAPSLRRSAKRLIYFRTRNSLWLALRDLPLSLWPAFLPAKQWHAFSLAFRLGKLPLFIRAWCDALRNLPDCLAMRHPLNRKLLRRAQIRAMRLWF